MVPLLKLGPFSNQWSQCTVLALNGWDQCINKRAHCRMGPTSMKGPKKYKLFTRKNKLQHVVMVPLLKLGPFSNQWSQCTVLTLNGWTECINKMSHYRRQWVQHLLSCVNVSSWVQKNDDNFGPNFQSVSNHIWSQA